MPGTMLNTSFILFLLCQYFSINHYMPFCDLMITVVSFSSYLFLHLSASCVRRSTWFRRPGKVSNLLLKSSLIPTLKHSTSTMAALMFLTCSLQFTIIMVVLVIGAFFQHHHLPQRARDALIAESLVLVGF